jgi:hypothetical protein
VDKVAKVPKKLARKIEETIKGLLKELERACGDSNSPSNIALAFGILIDKGKFGSQEKEDEESAPPVENDQERKALYEELEPGIVEKSKGGRQSGDD